MSEVKEITGVNFQDFITKPTANDELAVVQFRANWCGPCKILHKRLEEEIDSIEDTGKVRIATLDVDNESAITSKYNIRGIPTVLFFRNGELVAEQRRGPNIQTIKDAIKALTSEEEDEF